jgi:hypothetical protein
MSFREKYKVIPGPEGYLAPASAIMGAALPGLGRAFAEGEVVPEDEAIGRIAGKLAEAKNPAVCPGPLVMWEWSESAAPKAAALKKLIDACGAKVFPMTDYRPKNMPTAMNPYHPNVIIQNNDIDVCLFAGIHYHYANLMLRMIRGGTSCYTIALCDYAASDEAMLSLRDVDAAKIAAIVEKIKPPQGES